MNEKLFTVLNFKERTETDRVYYTSRYWRKRYHGTSLAENWLQLNLSQSVG